MIKCYIAQNKLRRSINKSSLTSVQLQEANSQLASKFIAKAMGDRGKQTSCFCKPLSDRL